jgi:hypothetical protein
MTGFTELVTEQELKLKNLLKDPSDLFEDGFEYFNHSDTVFNIPDPQIKIYAGPRKSLLEVIENLSWIGDYNFVADLGTGRLALSSPPDKMNHLAKNAGLVLVSIDNFKATGPLFRRVKSAIDPKSAFVTL